MNLRHAIRWYPSLLKDIIFKPSYRPAQFWEKRHAASHDFWTVGRRAFDECGNEEWYGRLAQDLLAAFDAERVELATLSVYEIGAGTGYWTRLVQSRGCRRYQGTDIAESAVAWLRPQYPGYEFAARDAATTPIPDLWDVILMMHVDEHIHSERFVAALCHIKTALAPGARVFTTYARTPQPSGVRYVEYHGLEDFAQVFPRTWIRELPQPHGGDPMLMISAGA